MEYVVLFEQPEDEVGNKAAWQVLGSVSATTRARAEEAVLEGTDGAPEIPLDVGEAGRVKLVAASAWNTGTIPLRAAQRTVLVRAA